MVRGKLSLAKIAMTEPLQVDGVPACCHNCGGALCLRKQVVNLALGNTDELLCLVCLGRDSERDPVDVLENIMGYIDSRDCFRKEWARYCDRTFCPDPAGCFPDTCFGGNE